MRTKNVSILLFALTGALLTGGCEKQDAGSTPATVVDLPASSESPAGADILSETIASPSTELAAPVPGQIPAANPASQETQKTDNETQTASKIDNETPATSNTDNATQTATKTDNTSQAPQKADNATPAATKDDNVTQPASKTDNTTQTPTATDNANTTNQNPNNAAPAATVNVTKTFHPNDGWASDFFFQLPEGWNYTVDEDTFDWGFFIQVDNREDASIRIFGQYGTLNVASSYTDAPTSFETCGGMKGTFYQRKQSGEDGFPYVEGDIVFDTDYSYSVHFSMPENVYNDYKDTLQAIFLSIRIEDIFTE